MKEPLEISMIGTARQETRAAWTSRLTGKMPAVIPHVRYGAAQSTARWQFVCVCAAAADTSSVGGPALTGATVVVWALGDGHDVPSLVSSNDGTRQQTRRTRCRLYVFVVELHSLRPSFM